MNDKEEFPYAGTSGHSGSEASRQRAERQDKSGKTTLYKGIALKRLAARKSKGLTWKELDDLTGWNHHGRTTGVLSNLHKEGLICRLTEQRDRCSVYVVPEWTKGRETAAQGRAKKDECATCEGMALMYESLKAEYDHLKASHAL